MRGDISDDYASSDDLPSIESVKVHHTAKVIRDWVRTVLCPPALKRLYDVGMGVQTFATPTAAGNVVNIEAPPVVQVNALKVITALGIPTQMGLVDGNDNEAQGILALPPLDLDAARQVAHGDRYVAPDVHARAVAQLQPGTAKPHEDELPASVVTPLRPMSERIAAGEFTVVEIDEGVKTADTREDAAPGPIADVETPAKAALRRHRERMAARARAPVSSALPRDEVAT